MLPAQADILLTAEGEMQQIEFGAAMASGETLEGIGKPSMRIDAVELRGFDQ